MREAKIERTKAESWLQNLRRFSQYLINGKISEWVEGLNNTAHNLI